MNTSNDDLNKQSSAVLVLADGSRFYGRALGNKQSTVGEVVFNTSMNGYQEIATDPSYAKQMVVLTYPHIGNVGINLNDNESFQVHLSGLIFKEASPIASNWRSRCTLEQFLIDHQISAMTHVDTRRLTRLLRNKGSQIGCIVFDNNIDQSLKKIKAFPGLSGIDLAKTVTTSRVYQWSEPSYELDQQIASRPLNHTSLHVVVYDFGVKQQILRLLVDYGCQVTVVPADYPINKVLALSPDGVLLSNGPGDPKACDYAIEAVRFLLNASTPILGICLGYQILALACGAITEKMAFGHHGANHPVQDLATKKVYITSQNHSFTVSEHSMPTDLKITHRSLFDGSIQGIQHQTQPAFGFQGHPEASPGPTEMMDLFERFIAMMQV